MIDVPGYYTSGLQTCPGQTEGLMPLMGVIEGGTEGSDVVRAHACPKREFGSMLVQRQTQGQPRESASVREALRGSAGLRFHPWGNILRWAGHQRNSKLAETNQPWDPCLEGRGCRNKC